MTLVLLHELLRITRIIKYFDKTIRVIRKN